jgi:hypothetical protein
LKLLFRFRDRLSLCWKTVTFILLSLGLNSCLQRNINPSISFQNRPPRAAETLYQLEADQSKVADWGTESAPTQYAAYGQNCAAR